ncbi:hypothetical protein LINPERHAP2_LOCUS9859, partial [Linum perenne]
MGEVVIVSKWRVGMGCGSVKVRSWNCFLLFLSFPSFFPFFFFFS